MASPEDRPSNLGPASEPAAAPDPDSSPTHTNAPGGRDAGRITGAIWLIALAVGLLAGAASFGIGEVGPELFKPSTEFTAAERARRNEIPSLIRARYQQRDDRVAMLAYGTLGILLGLGLGAVGGLARGSTPAAVVAGLVGLIIGGAAGGGTTAMVLPSYHASFVGKTDENADKDLGVALATHGAIWGAIGAAAGLALGLGLGGPARLIRAIVGGLLGAVIATVIYEFGSAVAFPISESFRPRAITVGPRLLAHLAVALCIAAVGCWAVDHLSLRRPRKGHGV